MGKIQIYNGCLRPRMHSFFGINTSMFHQFLFTETTFVSSNKLSSTWRILDNLKLCFRALLHVFHHAIHPFYVKIYILQYKPSAKPRQSFWTFIISSLAKNITLHFRSVTRSRRSG
mmetsp:Transcript_27906/g.50542  ORF Transcript_27906/g.50542 Transcript_27906/m.50542 type:complete len:116 (-) Transcript_27906:555-902(-)